MNPSEVGKLTLYQANTLFTSDKRLRIIGELPDAEEWVKERSPNWVKKPGKNLKRGE